jgi:hypothetical protein
VVYGSRFIGGKPHRILFFWHSIGNRFLTKLSNMFTNLNLTDMETCYKLFRADILKGLDLKEKRFGFEPELYAYEGFDIGYYFLESLMKFGNDIPDGITHYGKKMLQTQYYFARPLSSDGIENRYWNFGRHADYQYVPLRNTFFNE